jgi:hypothetical protein
MRAGSVFRFKKLITGDDMFLARNAENRRTYADSDQDMAGKKFLPFDRDRVGGKQTRASMKGIDSASRE